MGLQLKLKLESRYFKKESMNYGAIFGHDLTDVSCTMLLTLYGRALESQSNHPEIYDPVAERIVGQINEELSQSALKLFQSLSASKMKHSFIVHAAIRAKQYDFYTQEFIRSNPDCVVVNLGCGLDTRYFRLTEKPAHFYDLDLPEVIDLKTKLIDVTGNYKMVRYSALDHGWIDEVIKHDQPTIVIAEGLFMYLPKPDVINLVKAIGEKIPKGQLIAEVVNEKYTRGLGQWIVGFKFKHELGMDKAMTYECGISNGAELASWSDRLTLIDEWNYLESGSSKPGLSRLFRNVEMFTKTQWTVRCRIGA